MIPMELKSSTWESQKLKMFGGSDGKTRFAPVRQYDDSESLSATSASDDHENIPPPVQYPRHLVLLLLLVTFLASAALGAFLGMKASGGTENCIKKTSQFSPVVKEVPISYHLTLFNGSFMQENIFRQAASPEVDEAWQRLGVDYRGAAVPEELAAKSGLTERHIQIKEKYGGGYPANVEGLHHLHCLNLLRQGLYYNYEYYKSGGNGAFKNEEPILRLHITHCLDILRQQLMCAVDVGVLGRVWYNKQSPTAFPDFNTAHKCRNFEDVRKWAEEHQMPEKVPEDFLVPPEDLSVVSETMP